jgi:hypothetical protein
MSKEKTPVTVEWLEANGFRRDPVFGYVRDLGEGPGDTTLSLTVGTYPFNERCAALTVGGYGIETNADGSVEDMEALIRLFDGAGIDHPNEAWIDELDDDPELN